MAQFLDLTGLGHFKDKNDALYAKQDGSYEGMTVGNAEQLVSTVGVSDSAPYNFRTTGGSADVGDRMNLKAVVGGTVAWNQLVQNGNFSSNANWSWRLSGGGGVENNEGKLIAVNTTGNNQMYQSIALPANHKFLVTFSARKGADNSFSVLKVALASSNVLNVTKEVTLGTTKADYAVIMTHTASSDNLRFSLSASSLSVGDTAYISNVNLFDLTAMFGSTIADYVYTLESGTAGAGIAWLKKYGYFTKPYYPYNAASLESVKTSAHKTYGFNAYNPSTGKAKVVGGMVYQITGAYTALSLDGTSITPDANGYFTPSANGELTVTGGNSTTTCIHLKWDGERDGEWEEFSEHTYVLDDVELRGIPKLDASNNLYYDGDEYTPDGTVTRKFGIIAFNGAASENWSYTATLNRVIINLPLALAPASGYVNLNFIADRLVADNTQRDFNAYINDYKNLVIYAPSSITSAADWKTWLSSNPIDLVYELATPTIESADAYTELQICNDFGTEEFVDAATRDFDMPVGNVAVYAPNLRAKLEMAPNSPDANGDYLMRHSNGTNEYVLFSTVKELPDFPTTDGTYVLKCTVADGTATLSWVSE